MAAVLNDKQQRVLDKFAALPTRRIEASQVSFSGGNMMFNIAEPIIYKIENTDTILIFGDIRKSMSMDEIKAWLQSRMSEDASNPLDGEGDDVAGEEIEEVDAEAPLKSTEQAHPDDEKLKEADINLITSQMPNVSREEAIETLRKCNYDMVNALVELAKKN